MIILPHELETFQACPARWKLRDKFPLTITEPSDYIFALKRTVFRMYAWQMSNNKHMSPKSVRDYWDQQWWASGMQDETKDNTEVFERAANGWMLLERFYHNIYTRDGVLPVGVNFGFNLEIGTIDYKIHLDLILSDRDGIIEFIELGGKRSEWQIYTSLATKLEVCGLTNILQAPPSKKIHLDFSSKKTDYVQKILNLTPEYTADATELIACVSDIIQSDTIHASWSDSCKTCPAAGKCWY
jgi:hypothetical protein